MHMLVKILVASIKTGMDRIVMTSMHVPSGSSDIPVEVLLCACVWARAPGREREEC